MKTREKFIVVLLWLSCSLYTWGTFMAELEGISRQPPRDYLGACAGLAIMGPIGAVAGALTSNFNQYGWVLWQRPTEESQ